MNGKRALVVDDSKSARAFLARILEDYDLQVDMAESAEQAIDYLARNRPDVIFMDHLMPGMDGFQAVQSIKNNPRTAAIPIMMYTSQEGELYLGQARALGAIGVLPKTVKPADVSTVLYQLRLIEDRRLGQLEGIEPGNEAAREALGAGAGSAGAGTATEGAAPHRAETVVRIDGAPLEALRAEVAQLRSELAATVEAQATRVAGETREAIAAIPPPPPLPPPSRAPWFAAAAAAAGAAVFAALWWQETDSSLALTRTLLDAQAEARVARAEAVAARAEAKAALEAESAARAAAAGAALRLDPAATEPLVRAVPFGEPALAGPRLDALRGVLDDLLQRGVRGTVTVRSFAGRFCLANGSAGGYVPAAAETPLVACATRGNPVEEPPGQPAREPAAFSELAASIAERSGGALRLVLARGGDGEHRVPYPDEAANPTAGEWNRAAAANNRIEIGLQAQAG